MNYAGIKYPDVSNGPGCRISLFVSGCRMNCPGCWNEESQNFKFGDEYNNESRDSILEKLNYSWISGLSLLGGDPLEQENQKDVAELVLLAKKQNPEKDIWLWTGRIYPDLPETQYLKTILDNVDVLIDGPFILAKRDLTLDWRGSDNQRILTKEDRLKIDTEVKKDEN